MLLVALISPVVAEAAVPTPIELNCEFWLVLVNVAAEPVVFWFNVGNVQFVSVPEDGVPRAGVVSEGDESEGEVERTTLPEPVEDVTPVPPLATPRVPLT